MDARSSVTRIGVRDVPRFSDSIEIARPPELVWRLIGTPESWFDASCIGNGGVPRMLSEPERPSRSAEAGLDREPVTWVRAGHYYRPLCGFAFIDFDEHEATVTYVDERGAELHTQAI
jgi:hypothetical protein